MIQVAQIIFILSVLVILHEFGHYFAAKIFKVRVEKFYLFMDAGFSLFKKKIGETEWGIGWLPLGGYVKLSGMIDESMDTEQLKQEPQPWEFRSKPAWQRLIIMMGGIFVNIVLAITIYTVMFSTVGQKYISTEKIQKNGLAFGVVGQHVGFKNGDKIVSVDGKFIPDFKFAIMGILFSDKVEVNRNGKTINLSLTDEQKGEIIKKEGKSFVQTRIELNKIFIDSLDEKKVFTVKRFDKIVGANNKKFTYYDELISEAKFNKNKSMNLLINRNAKDTLIVVKINKEGKFVDDFFVNEDYLLSTNKIKDPLENETLKSNDVIVSLDGKQSNLEFKRALNENKGKTVVLKIKRDEKIIDVGSRVNEYGKLGIQFDESKNSEYSIVNKLGLAGAFKEALNQSWNKVVYNYNSFKLIFRPATGAYTQVKSPIGIARMLPDTWDWEFVWGFIALFSIGLAFMNCLPIPGLDGGHALFTIAEMITGKTLSEKAMANIQTGGMIFLLSLMVLTFGKDAYQLVMDKFF